MAITPVPTLTDIPPFPALADRAAGAYNSKAYAFGTHMADQFNGEIAAVASNVRNNATEAYQSAQAAQQAAAGVVEGAAAQAEAAAISAASAAESASAAAAVTSAVPWVSGTTYAQFAVAISLINFKTYRKITTSTGGTVDPSNDPTNWLLLGALAMPRRARTANVKIMANDISAMIDITSGTFTQTFDTAASLGAGWFCYVRNTGAGDITIPDSDGVQGWIMYSNECRLFMSDGAVLRSVVIIPFHKEYAASGNFVKPPGYRVFSGEIWNGGSSGSNGLWPGTNSNVWGQGGFGGASSSAMEFIIHAGKLAASTSIMVGAGGIAPSGQTTATGPGGGSSFGNISVPAMPTSSSQSGAYYSGSGGASYGNAASTALKGAGAGGGGAGARDDSEASPGYPAGAGGVSLMAGSGGNGGALGVAGGAGSIPGGGGGGGGGTRGSPSGTNTPGGAGARGQVNVWGAA